MPCWGRKRKNKVVKTCTDEKAILDNASSNSSRSSQSSLKNRGNSIIIEYAKSHPTESIEILKNIFHTLSVNELILARQVCKMWNKAACYWLRRKIEGAIVLQRGISYYTRVMIRSLDIPIGRLFLKIDDMQDPGNAYDVEKFLNVAGNSILNLVLNLEGSSFPQFVTHIHHLSEIQRLSINLFQEVTEEQEEINEKKRKRAASIQILIQDFDEDKKAPPKLESLESLVISCEPDWQARDDARIIKKLLDMSPNLRNLNLTKWPYFLGNDIFKNVQLQHIKFLMLPILNEDQLMSLKALDLNNLSSLEFQAADEVKSTTLQEVIAKFHKTLEYLEIRNPCNQLLEFRLLLEMEKLTTLRFQGWIGPIFLDSIQYRAPVLEKLQLSHVNPLQILTRETKPVPSVYYLAVNFGSGNPPIKKIFKRIKTFVNVFPNLKVFMMKRVSDKVLEIICEGWPKLEALRITTSYALTDYGVTGVPASTLQIIQKEHKKLSCGCCVPLEVKNGRPDFKDERITPHLALLRNLHELRIEAEKGTHWALTNFTLHLAIGELRKLRILKLNCHDDYGPIWCLRWIADNLKKLQQLGIMDRNHSMYKYDEEDLNYLLSKLPDLHLDYIPKL